MYEHDPDRKETINTTEREVGWKDIVTIVIEEVFPLRASHPRYTLSQKCG